MTNQQPYTLFKFISGGSYSTGADWKSQFANAAFYCAMPTIGGVAMLPGVQAAYGVYAGFALNSANPFDSKVLILEASVGAPVQVYVNDALIDEVDAPGELSLPLISGLNKVEIVRSQSPLVFIPSGALIDPKSQTNSWFSLYPSGEDPFTSSTAGGGTTKPTAVLFGGF